MHILLLYLMVACPTDATRVCQTSPFSAEYNSAETCGAAGLKFKETLPLADIGGVIVGDQLGVRWTCKPK